MPNSPIFRRLRRAAPAASSLRRPARPAGRRAWPPRQRLRWAVVHPCMVYGCTPRSMEMECGVRIGEAPGGKFASPAARKCSGALRRRLLLLGGGPRKKRYFCCARWNMAYYGVWIMEYWSMPLRQRRRSSRVYGVWPAGGRHEAAGYVWSTPHTVLLA